MSLFLSSIIFIILLLGLIVFHQNRKLKRRIKNTEQMLLDSLQSEKNNQKKIGEVIHDKLQGDLIATKNFIFIYSQLKDDQDKIDILSNIQLTLNASIENTKNLSHKLIPPFLDKGDFVKAINYYFERINKTSEKQFSVENSVESFILEDEKAYNLFRIVEMFCDYIIEKGSVTQFWLVIARDKIELIDNGDPFTLDFKRLSLSEIMFLGLPSRLTMLNAEIIQQITGSGNHFVLQFTNERI